MKTTMNKIINGIRKQPPGRLITGGFALVILLGALILLLPVSVKDGAVVTPIDALIYLYKRGMRNWPDRHRHGGSLYSVRAGCCCGADPDRRSWGNFCWCWIYAGDQETCQHENQDDGQ